MALRAAGAAWKLMGWSCRGRWRRFGVGRRGEGDSADSVAVGVTEGGKKKLQTQNPKHTTLGQRRDGGSPCDRI